MGGIGTGVSNNQPIAQQLNILACALCALLAIALMFLSGCQGAIREASFIEGKSLSGTTLTRADKGKSVTIRPGETVEISLDENPSTGFQWALEQDNGAVLELLNSYYIQESSSGIGGGGQRIWKFEAKKNGNAWIAMKRWRTWEGDKSIVERLEFTIKVKR